MPTKLFVRDRVAKTTIEMFGIDAREAVRLDPDRYEIGDAVPERQINSGNDRQHRSQRMT